MGENIEIGRGLDHYKDPLFKPIGEVKKGLFVVVDGLDGIGKGEIERALRGFEERSGKAVFDSISFCKAYEELPELSDFYGIPRPHYNTIMTAEPTYSGIGKVIRDEITIRNSREYPAEVQVQLYSNDRLVQMMRVVVPALNHGLNVIQSRCMASTLTYQLLKSNDEGNADEDSLINDILRQPGNDYQAKNRPDLLIIPTIESSEQLMERLRERGVNEKEDRSMFENAEFQGRLKPLYDSPKLKSLFEGFGTKVAYINAGLGIESSRAQAVDVYRHFLETGSIEDRHSSPERVLRSIQKGKSKKL